MACDKSRPLSCRRRHDSAVIRDSQQQSQRLHGMGVDTRTLKKVDKFTTANRGDRIWQPPAKTRAVSNKKSKLGIVLISTFREPAATHHVGWGWSNVVFKVKSLVCNFRQLSKMLRFRTGSAFGQIKTDWKTEADVTVLISWRQWP